jgi:hypothetical protein
VLHSLLGGTMNFKQNIDTRTGKTYTNRMLLSQARRDGVGPPQINVRYDSFEAAFLRLCEREIDPVSRHIPYCVTDQEGEIPWGAFPHRRTVVGAAQPATIAARRRQVLEQLVPRACEPWLAT